MSYQKEQDEKKREDYLRAYKGKSLEELKSASIKVASELAQKNPTNFSKAIKKNIRLNVIKELINLKENGRKK